jgi:hypothetical protein
MSRNIEEGWYVGKGFGYHRRQRVRKEKPSSFLARMPFVLPRGKYTKQYKGKKPRELL